MWRQPLRRATGRPEERDFTNTTGDAVFDGTLKQALACDS